jgi:phenylacetate-CoA ligase
MDLYTRLFERTVFPLLDLANGSSIARKLELLLASEHVGREEIRRRQEENVARVVEATRRRSDFYHRHWQKGGGPASRFAPLDGLPVVTKNDFAGAAGAFPLADTKGKVLSFRTSGSTGRPMVFHRTAEQDSWFWALRFRIWRWAGYHPGDPYLTINLNPRLGFKKKLQDRLFRCAYLTFNADNQDSQRVAETLRQNGIAHLNGFSSSLYVLAQYLLRREESISTVKGITSTGDTLYPVYREAVEKAFGTQVLDYYGAGGEGIHLASQTYESGGRYLLHPENALVEFLGPEGPVGPGELGRIVLTQFHNDAMPLVRYELGDLAVPAPEEAFCPSGRTLPLMERVEGRVPDLIVVPDGSFLVPHFFVVLFKNLQSIHRYQIVQKQEGRMKAVLVPHAGCNRQQVEDLIKRDVETATRGQIEVDFEWVEEIPLSGAGKRRLVISDLAKRLVQRPEDREARLETGA